MKKIIGMTLTAVVAIALAILGVIFCPPAMSNLQKEAFYLVLIMCAVSATYCFLVGEISRNNSQMDKLWSILPIIYTWTIAIKAWGNIRLIVIAILATLWGARLTYNFAKKGAYSIKFWQGEEDYRWKILRQNKYFKNKVVWAIFDLLFISVYQNLLVLAICLPAIAVIDSTKPFGIFDAVVALLTFFFIALETIADKQQMRFYNKRKELMGDGKKLEEIEAPYNKGFNTTGLWKYSRHPNYFSEQAIWISIYLFTMSASVTVYGVFHWSGVGCMLLILLFLGSSNLSESISSSKYKDYPTYISQTSRYIPWFSKAK